MNRADHQYHYLEHTNYVDFDDLFKQLECMSHLLLLGKFEYGGGPIFKVVLEC